MIVREGQVTGHIALEIWELVARDLRPTCVIADQCNDGYLMTQRSQQTAFNGMAHLMTIEGVELSNTIAQRAISIDDPNLTDQQLNGTPSSHQHWVGTAWHQAQTRHQHRGFQRHLGQANAMDLEGCGTLSYGVDCALHRKMYAAVPTKSPPSATRILFTLSDRWPVEITCLPTVLVPNH